VDDVDQPVRIVLPEPYGTPRSWPHLIVANYPVLGEVYRVLQPDTIIGRELGADVRLFDGMVSRRHARITFDGDQIAVEDLRSTFGTTVGDEVVIGPRVLRDGEVITLGGGTRLRLAHENILDTAVRPAPSPFAVNTAAFLDEIRIGQVRARSLLLPLTFALLRIDTREAGTSARDDRLLDGAARKLMTSVRETVPAGYLLARSAQDELVLVLREPLDRAIVTLERLCRRVEHARQRNENGSPLAGTITVAVLPRPATGAVAPETILCALGDQGRRAIAGETNRVVSLPSLGEEPLSIEWR
jgi:hypothetical protein